MGEQPRGADQRQDENSQVFEILFSTSFAIVGPSHQSYFAGLGDMADADGLPAPSTICEPTKINIRIGTVNDRQNAMCGECP